MRDGCHIDLISEPLKDVRDLVATAQSIENLRRRSKFMSKLGVLAFHFGLRCPQADFISAIRPETIGTFDTRTLAITLNGIPRSDRLSEESCKQCSRPGIIILPLYAFSGN